MIELNTIYQEPCLDTVERMENNSIDCVITSPPYYQLRDYGYPEQWGLEPTYYEYLEHLWQLMDGIYRVLKPGGTVWINLGDSYAGSMGMGSQNDHKHKNGMAVIKQFTKGRSVEIKNKSLMLIPHRFAIGCIDRGWIVRNDIIWAKRNGMPESVTDRFSKKHEYFFFMVKSEKYFFDLDAIRDKHKTSNNIKDLGTRGVQGYSNASGGQRDVSGGFGYGKKETTTKIPREQAEMFGSPRARQHRGKKHTSHKSKEYGQTSKSELYDNPNGKNPGSVSDFWDIPTKPSSEKHYASYNDSLLVKPVLAGCPEGGIIYDPFMGTGSTAEVALRSNRNFIGSEMKPEYCEIANKRLLPFLSQVKLF